MGTKYTRVVLIPSHCFTSTDFLLSFEQRTHTAGDQTITDISRCAPDRAHDIVGVLLPFNGHEVAEADGSFDHGSNLRILPWKKKFTNMVDLVPVSVKQFDWLASTEPPKDLEFVHIFTIRSPDHDDTKSKLDYFRPPSIDYPILQSHVDIIVEGALKHGEAFAAEWLEQIQWWINDDGSSFYLNDREEARRPWNHKPIVSNIDAILEKHPGCFSACKSRKYETEYFYHATATMSKTISSTRPLEVQSPPPVTKRYATKNFLIGFGSIINTASRCASDNSCSYAVPCRVKAEFGYVREWNFQASTAQICALGLRRISPGEQGSTINGVIFPATDDMTSFDRRENGYMRVEVPLEHVEILSSSTQLPSNAKIFVYVPFAPEVVTKYGVDPKTGLTRCSGPVPPEGSLPFEAPGLGLHPPSYEYPILQTYIDVCILGCLEYGEKFATEFIQTTFLWTKFWLNERELSRRPWLHQKGYVKIDTLLRDALPLHFANRKLQSEYACLSDKQ